MKIEDLTESISKGRSIDLIENARDVYAHAVEKQQSVDLLCLTGGREIDVHSATALDSNLIKIVGVENDAACSVIAPAEQVVFLTVASASKEPPREIGFHSEVSHRA